MRRATTTLSIPARSFDDLNFSITRSKSNGLHRLRLADSYLHRDKPRLVQQPQRFRQQPPVRIQPVRAAVEGQPGLVIPDLRLQAFDLIARKIRRVGDYRVEFQSKTGDRSQQITREQFDSARQSMLL